MPIASEESPADPQPEPKEVQGDATTEEVLEPPPQLFHPLNWEILALLMPASVFGVLARLGLVSLTSYNGESIFPLAYVQGVGCLVMGFCLALKVPISEWCVSSVPEPWRFLSAERSSQPATPPFTLRSRPVSIFLSARYYPPLTSHRLLWVPDNLLQLAIRRIWFLDKLFRC